MVGKWGAFAVSASRVQWKIILCVLHVFVEVVNNSFYVVVIIALRLHGDSFEYILL